VRRLPDSVIREPGLRRLVLRNSASSWRVEGPSQHQRHMFFARPRLAASRFPEFLFGCCCCQHDETVDWSGLPGKQNRLWCQAVCIEMDGLDFVETQRMGCEHKILSHLTRTRLDSSERKGMESPVCTRFKLLIIIFLYLIVFYSKYFQTYKIISYILTFLSNKINYNKIYDFLKTIRLK
jgi:hypothetical protein